MADSLRCCRLAYASSTPLAVSDSDLQVRGGGGERGVSEKLFFALWASVWVKNRGPPPPPPPPPRAPALDPLLIGIPCNGLK